MINNRQNNRRRGRGGGSGNGGIRATGPSGGIDRGNRIDNRARGNASQLHEKYKTLARDAQTQSDRVMTEYYLQFADHYYRIINETRSRAEEQQQRRPRDDQFERDDQEEFGDEEAFTENAGNRAPRRDEQRVASHDREPRQPREQREPREFREPREPRQATYHDQADGEGAPERGRDEEDDNRRRYTRDRGQQNEEAAPLRPARAPRPRATEDLVEQAEVAAVSEDQAVAVRPRGRGRPPREARVVEPVSEERIEIDRLPPAFAAAPEAAEDDAAAKPKRRGRPPRRLEVPAADA